MSLARDMRVSSRQHRRALELKSPGKRSGEAGSQRSLRIQGGKDTKIYPIIRTKYIQEMDVLVKQVKIELDVQEHSKKNEIRDAILSLFDDGPLATWQITDALGSIPSSSIRQTLSKLVARGELVRVHHGVYRLP